MIPYNAQLVQSVIGRTSFGVWDLLNAGADPFGAPVRARWSAEDAIALLGKLGVPRVSLHDLDVGLDPWVTPDPKALDARLSTLKGALAQAGVRVWMYTPCLFHHPLVRAGSVTANDVRVRKMSLQKIFYAIDVAAEFGADWVTFWFGRDGAEVDALIDSAAAYRRTADALEMACAYIREQGYTLRLTMEPKPNEPRGDIYVSTVGTALGIINMLPPEYRDMVGVNPELLQHEGMAGLNAYHAMGQLIAAGKLAFLHLGGQTPLRYDQDHPFLGGNSDLKASFYVVLALVKHAADCVCEFDCHPFRTEAHDGAREEFIMGNIEALGMMVDKVTRFLALPEVRDLLADTETRGFGAAVCPHDDPRAFFADIKGTRLSAEEVSASLQPRAQYLDRLVNLHLLGYLNA